MSGWRGSWTGSWSGDWFGAQEAEEGDTSASGVVLTVQASLIVGIATAESNIHIGGTGVAGPIVPRRRPKPISVSVHAEGVLFICFARLLIPGRGEAISFLPGVASAGASARGAVIRAMVRGGYVGDGEITEEEILVLAEAA